MLQVNENFSLIIDSILYPEEILKKPLRRTLSILHSFGVFIEVHK